MQKDTRHFHRIILRKLYTHLRKNYSIRVSKTPPLEGRRSLRYADTLLAFRSDATLEQLRAALDRLEEGTFGVCLACKENIDAGWLDTDPTRRMCERCEIAQSGRAAKYEGAFLAP